MPQRESHVFQKRKDDSRRLAYTPTYSLTLNRGHTGTWNPKPILNLSGPILLLHIRFHPSDSANNRMRHYKHPCPLSVIFCLRVDDELFIGGRMLQSQGVHCRPMSILRCIPEPPAKMI